MLTTQISKANLYGKDKIILCNPQNKQSAPEGMFPETLSAFMGKIRKDYINCEEVKREPDDL